MNLLPIIAQRNLGSGFTPAVYSPLQWFADTGASAATWPDLSGNALDAVQATGSKQPSIISAAQNGRQARRFDGIDDTLAHGLSVTADSDVFVVLNYTRPSNPAAGEVLYSAAAPSTGLKCYLGAHLNISHFWGSYRSTERSSGQSLIGSGWTLLQMRTTSTGGEFWRDGVSLGTYSDATYYSDASDRRSISSMEPGDAFLMADIGELLVFNALTAPQAANVTAYLKARWATP